MVTSVMRTCVSEYSVRCCACPLIGRSHRAKESGVAPISQKDLFYCVSLCLGTVHDERLMPHNKKKLLFKEAFN